MRNMNIKIVEDKQNKKFGKNNDLSSHSFGHFFFEDSFWRFFRLLRSVREACLIYKKWHTVVL